MSATAPRPTTERLAALLPLIRAFLVERYVDEKLVLKSENVEELSGPLGQLVASVITADAASQLARSSRRLEVLTYTLIVLTVVLVGVEIVSVCLGK